MKKIQNKLNNFISKYSDNISIYNKEFIDITKNI